MSDLEQHNIVNNLPINLLIDQLNNIKGSQITFAELKEELSKKNDSVNKYNISIKEDENLFMLYYNSSKNSTPDDFITKLENSCRSIILDKQTLKPIVTQYNKIIYNGDSIEYLKNKNWDQVVVQKCYEGTLITIFYQNDKWYITTRRCLNAQESSWIKNNSYYDMFVDAMSGKFTFDELDKNYCYHFILVHHKNKNIVTYNNTLGREYKELFHILTTEKYTLKELNYKINDKVKYVENEKFNSLNEMLSELNKLSVMDKKYQKITSEGYVLKYYDGKIGQSQFTTLKIQTEIYETIMKLKPNNSNIYQCFLELYQKNQLNDFLPYFTKYSNDVIKRIHISMQNISKELLDLYHLTRNKQNEDIYNKLSDQYKKCLYEIHGIYIKNRKNDFQEGADKKQMGNTKSINVFDVYHYLKSIPMNDLRQIYYERISMVDNPLFKFINKSCINTMTQCTLMFKCAQKSN